MATRRETVSASKGGDIADDYEHDAEAEDGHIDDYKQDAEADKASSHIRSSGQHISHRPHHAQ